MLSLRVESISDPASRTLDAWSAYLVPFDGPDQPWTCHVTGFRREGCKGQVSSPVMAVDPERRLVRTRSGRVYELAGRPGMNPDAFATWGQWKHRQRVRSDRDVTEQLDEMLSPPWAG